MRKRFIKRSLELIGAIAIVYIIIDVIDSNTKHDDKLEAKEVKANPIDEHAKQIESLHQALAELRAEQAKVKEAVPPVIVPAAQPVQPVQVKVNQEPPKEVQGSRMNDKIHAAPVKKPAPVPAKPAGPPAKPKPEGPQVSLDLGVNTNFEKMNIPQPKIKSKGFVLPMLYFDMGPNNLFRLFRQGVVTAYEMGRNVAVPVFHRHPRMGDAAENPFVLPIFDTNYTVDLVWSPGETVDVGSLKKFMGVYGMKEFKKECQGKLDAVVKCGTLDPKRLEGIKHFQRAADMKVMKEIEIASYEELVPNDFSPGIIKPNQYKCLGVVYGKKCLPDQDRWLATFARISKYFWRPLPVRKFAMNFIENVMNNRKFMAVHWRYESDWLDMCKPSRPKGARERNREICRITMGLTYDDEVRNNFIQAVKDKLADYNLQTIFLASPPNNIDLIRLFNQSFPGNFFYSDDVEKYALKTEGPDFMTNNYKASFVEQEICFRSALYLGAPLSSWTQTVLTDRLSRNIKQHDSVLRVVGEGRPGFPELVFQFPEGNFNFGGMIPGKKVR